MFGLVGCWWLIGRKFWFCFSDVIIYLYWIKVHFSICCSLSHCFCFLTSIFCFKIRERSWDHCDTFMDWKSSKSKRKEQGYLYLCKQHWKDSIKQYIVTTDVKCIWNVKKKLYCYDHSSLSLLQLLWFILCLLFKSDSMKGLVLHTN